MKTCARKDPSDETLCVHNSRSSSVRARPMASSSGCDACGVSQWHSSEVPRLRFDLTLPASSHTLRSLMNAPKEAFSGAATSKAFLRPPLSSLPWTKYELGQTSWAGPGCNGRRVLEVPPPITDCWSTNAPPLQERSFRVVNEVSARNRAPRIGDAG